MTYIRGEAAAIDAWEELGNPGWNWESLFPYYKKSENSTVPSDAQLAAGATYESQYHGFNGHIRTGYPATLANGSFAPVVIQTWEDLSLPHNPDLNSGRLPGFSMGPQTIDGELGLRWDAARAYYYPVEGRPNLKIIQGTVKRITWAPKSRKGLPFGSQPPMVATGVEYLTNDGKTNVLCIRKEVILSAGALRTPLVLEGSGIGNSRFETDTTLLGNDKN
jgi:choline dehydrogenase